MFKIFNINPREHSKVLIASDFHLGHKREFVWGARGFDSVESHDEFILNHLMSLPSDALLVFLGDFALNCPLERVERTLRDIRCKVLMTWGNHVSGIKQIYKTAMGDEDCEEYPLQMFPDREIWMMGETLTLSLGKRRKYYCQHMAPMVWDNMKYGVPALVGHSHGNLQGANLDDSGIGKILDVGVENAIKHNGTPFFSLDEVDEIIAKKPIRFWDHHGDENI